jgi:hypothetical protein
MLSLVKKDLLVKNRTFLEGGGMCYELALQVVDENEEARRSEKGIVLVVLGMIW